MKYGRKEGGRGKSEGKERRPEVQKAGSPEGRKARSPEGRRQRKKSGSPEVRKSSHYNKRRLEGLEGRKSRRPKAKEEVQKAEGKGRSPEVQKSGSPVITIKDIKDIKEIIVVAFYSLPLWGRAGEEARGPGRGSFYFILPRFFTFCSKLSRSLRAPFFVRAR